jgi:hypothetical protein
MLLCENNSLEQKTVHLSKANYVHALLYNAAKQMFHCEVHSETAVRIKPEAL